ncbi:MAG TPA: enoyl-CoA hydratase/isomerase family protein [Blastocatellia bacterium]|nr:enoyl-CoA hydratase/isomerase family protein [Blastocatellia bacterium]HMV84345.1 enoyl-CoA hydratase/isomerase family protein [Blastocatellia bacterium]HMX26959.1 enoyl-CoA hydratase/isomerase family protein [Blastocatellia bacterium]HMZ19671.1 enoyl-CoA hydratase/isomerase family protein [Blastocatellia bacterium]HNG30666.1 enoyl-CoA hydratase/isomerase family protein [Blastocatellia bacterium]
MQSYKGETLSWELKDGCIELSLHREPANEIGLKTLAELEAFVAAHETLQHEAHALIIHSQMKHGFSAGADLRDLYHQAKEMGFENAAPLVRDFLNRIHAVMNAIDASPLTTIAAVHGICFGGGFELALACDLIFADKMARFCFPELRLGLIPGFGGIPRLKRDLGNAIVRDLLLTGRSINATKAQTIGLASQLAAEGDSLKLARFTAAQLKKFDRATSIAAKRFIKPIPHDELRQEIDIFCNLFAQPAVEAGLRKFVESTDALPYLP